MTCPVCANFAVMKDLAENIPGLSKTINAFLVAHLSTVHGIVYRELEPAPEDLIRQEQEMSIPADSDTQEAG